MNSLSQLDRNTTIKEFYAKHKSNGKSFTVKHFTLMGLGKSQLYQKIFFELLQACLSSRAHCSYKEKNKEKMHNFEKK